MRYLSLFSFIAALILLASCHSADVAIAFGFVFILIWLVLAILQGLFDVIL